MQGSANTVPWWKEPTKSQWAAFLAAWSGWILDAFDFTIYILAVPAIAEEFDVSYTAASGSVTLTLLVRLLGGFAAGAVADRWGRKLPLMISIVWFAVCDGAVAFAPSFAWILVLRTLFGFGMGAEWTSGTTLAMENWPERSRGIASGILQGSWAIGYLLAAAVSAYVLPRWGWRTMFVIAAAPAVLVLPIRMWVKESDEWKRAVRAKAAPLRDLFRPELVRMLVAGSIVMGLGFGVYYGLVGPAYPAMLKSEHALDAAGIGRMLVLFNLGMLGGAVLTGALARRRGVVVAVVLPALAMVPLLPLFVGLAPGLLELGAFAGGFVGVGFTGVVPLLLTGMFPPEVRARCVGIVYHVGAFFAAFVPPLVTALAEHGGLSLSASIAIVAGSFEILLAVSLLAQRRTVTVAPAGSPH
jgi:SHS family lactate transporter-like MFS transporter